MSKSRDASRPSPPVPDDLLGLAAVIAHQLKSPVSSASTIIRTVLGGFAGEITAKQRELLLAADRKCLESIETAQRLLAIHRFTAGNSGSSARHAATVAASSDTGGRSGSGK